MRKVTYTIAILATLMLAACDEDEPVLTPAPAEPKLDYYVESFEVDGLGFEPVMRVDYSYDLSGHLTRYTVSSYHPESDSMEELRYFDFSYLNDNVDSIKGYLPDTETPYVEYSYQYLPNNKVSTINEYNHGAGVNSGATFSYDNDNNSVKVSYVFSNGGSFEYEFSFAGDNISNDRTTRGSQLCSEGEYTYDQRINPFSRLGYVDYVLNNLSTNNKLTEEVSYKACAFPTLVPQSYTYEYNEQGYPVLVTTNYITGSTLKKAQKEIFYK